MGRLVLLASTLVAVLLVVALVVAVALGVGRVAPAPGSPDARAEAAARAAPTPTPSAGSTAQETPPTEPQLRHAAEQRFDFRLGPIRHVVVHPDATDFAARTTGPGGPLLLFLPATGHIPDQYVDYLSAAAKSGYHVLGLDFWNLGHAVADECQKDPRCYLDVQRNRFDGSRPDTFSKVDAANSVLGRLGAALAHLKATDPEGGWGDYQGADGRIRWGRIVVSGHSQGGGEASYIAHVFPVQGQVTFSSPIIVDDGIDASWIGTPSATPPSRMWAFDDSHDEFYDRIRPSWERLGFGADPLVARIPVPAAGAAPHALVSTLPLGTPAQAHLRSVDDLTPEDDAGTPLFQPVWEWLLAQARAAGPR